MDSYPRHDSGKHEPRASLLITSLTARNSSRLSLSDPKNMENPKSEFFIPLMVDKLINDKTATVEVLDTASKWFGVTYPEDRQEVVDKIQALIDAGEYPAKLF